MKRIFLVGALGATAVVLAALSTTHAEPSAPVPAVFDGTRPDPAKTPGAVRTTDRNEICNRKTSEVRYVPDSLKEAIRRDYGLAHKRDKWCSGEEACEIDHLIPLAAGGSNDQTNLWPQTYDRSVTWNAHVKDRLEVKLRKLICKQGADIATIQSEVAKDWVAAYRKYVGEAPEAADPRDRAE